MKNRMKIVLRVKLPKLRLPYAQMGGGWYKINIWYKTPYQPLEIGLQNLTTDIGTYFWPSSVSGLPSMAKTSTESNKTVKCLLHLVLKTTRDR